MNTLSRYLLLQYYQIAERDYEEESYVEKKMQRDFYP